MRPQPTVLFGKVGQFVAHNLDTVDGGPGIQSDLSGLLYTKGQI